MSELAPPTGEAQTGAPQTGEPRVDEALRGVADLGEVPVDEHAERLATAHVALQEVLRQPDVGSRENDPTTSE